MTETPRQPAAAHPWPPPGGGQAELDISVLIPTYNRAEILRETLEAMCSVDREGLSVEFVVIDNNSNDHTRQVVESFTDRLPIRYLFEPRPGKNCALNKALDEVPLGEIVVFTDDDVIPDRTWLGEIASAARRWPQYSVFGGKISAIWPDGSPPPWLTRGPSFGLAGHDLGSSPIEYDPTGSDLPCGANLWAREHIFSGQRRYSESVGPHPTDRIMGSETSLLLQLQQEGQRMLYVPFAVVGHGIQESLLRPAAIRRRAYASGRGTARMAAICQEGPWRRHPLLWGVRRILSLCWATVRYVSSLFRPQGARRLAVSLAPLADIGYNVEMLRMAMQPTGIRNRRTARQTS